MSNPLHRETIYVREVVLTYGPKKREPLPAVLTSKDVVRLEPIQRISDLLVEHFVCIALNSRHKPIAWTTIGIGSVAACPVSPGDILRFLVTTGACSFVVAHNHPSGDPSPSQEDIILTERIDNAARLLGVHLLDHVIVASDSSFSFLDNGTFFKNFSSFFKIVKFPTKGSTTS